ncbi:hypothetical protein CGCF415_v006520 [Colletotrichum fructicola]|nr:hypothetical protein CGCF415_v006520 [Colletotrichum fructicola]KAF4938895.1 hypothetical protein CGCF245_v004165 [Colletotrichum fructicola]KAF5509007.1 hypothetical protein CGCF413_v003667 [Colletotrichum fructicola]
MLLVIWAFSPLGAQAILRLLDTRLESVIHPVSVIYFDDQRATYKNSVEYLEGTASDDGINRNIFGNLAILYNILVTAPKSVKIDSMDPWGNLRIPFMDPAVPEGWANTSTDPLDIRHSSLAGVPVDYGNVENSSFSLESTYIQLDCRNVTRFPAIGPNGPLRTSRSNMTSPSTANRIYPNGSWYGYDYSRGTGRASSAQWCIAVDRFIDSFWSNSTERLKVPAEMANETGIEVASTNLLLKLGLRQDDWIKRTFDEEEYTCQVAQKYVESKVSCLRPNGQRLCKVVAQRPSQQNYASEFITRLSSPRVFNFISRELPLTTGKATDGVLDPSIYYLKDPTFEDVSTGAEVHLGDLDPHQVGIRLSQLINTYISLSQLSGLITNGSSNGNAIEPNITIPGESSELSDVFTISTLWLGLCLLSSLILLSGGVMSVVFTHLADGPEVLGSVSTVVRNSRYIDLPSSMSWMDGSDITYQIKEMRIKYGFTREVSGEEPVVAVGHEYQTANIKDTA